MLHKEIPFLRIGLPFYAGIISGLYFEPERLFLAIVIVFASAGLISSLFFNRYRANVIYGAALSASLYLCGILLYSHEKKSLSILKQEVAFFKCFLSDYPEEKENSYKFSVDLISQSTHSGDLPLKGSLLIYCRKKAPLPTLLPGDLMVIKCTPSPIVNRGNPFEFDYKFWSENQGILYSAFTESKDITSHSSPLHRKISYSALIIREKIIDMYRQRGITGDRLALIAAMTLGQKNMLDPEQKQNFIKAGVMHVMAVSGLHSVILSMFVFSLLFFLKGRFNILRIIITIIILWAFAFVTGLTPSVLRATLMFTFIQAGDLMKRRVNSLNSVLASAFVLAVIQPSVIFDAGFQLSYAAVIFIISFYNDLYSKLKFKKWLPDKIWQSAAVTLTAQAGTLPLTILLFNRFPTYFILSNLIIVPLSSLLIITGCILPLTYTVHFVSRLIALVLDFQTGLTASLTEIASSLPYASIENIGSTIIECVVLSMVVYICCCYLLRKRSFSVLYPLSLILLFETVSTITNVITKRTDELIVYNSPAASNIGIRTGNKLNIWSDTSDTGAEIKRHAAVLGLKLKINNLSNRTACIKADGKNFLICNKLNHNTFNDLTPDYIILYGRRPQITKNAIPQNFRGTIIVTSEASTAVKLNYGGGKQPDIAPYYVRKSGAYRKRI